MRFFQNHVFGTLVHDYSKTNNPIYFKFCTQLDNAIVSDMNYQFYENYYKFFFLYTFICENFTVKFDRLLNPCAIFLIFNFFHLPLIYIKAMNVKEEKFLLYFR